MNRRSFIKHSISIGVSVAVLKSNLFALKNNSIIKIAHLADLHIGGDASKLNRNYLRDAIDDINSKQVDATIICGDLLHMMKFKFAPELKSILSKLNSPYYYVPGNHDVGMIPSQKTLNQYRVLLGCDYFKFEIKNWLFVGINSQLLQGGPKREQEKQLEWLSNSLDYGHGNSKGIIVFGHMPIFINNINEKFSVNNNISLKMRELLFSLFKEKRVAAYFHGHLHRQNFLRHEGIKLASSRTIGNRPLGIDKKSGFGVWSLTRSPISTVYEDVSYSIVR